MFLMQNSRRCSNNIMMWVMFFLMSMLAGQSVAAISTMPVAPSVEATAYVLQDFHSGKVLAEKNSEKKVEPASLTKMMTIYVVENELKRGNISLSDKVKISEKAWRMEGSRMFIEVNSWVTVDDLIKGVIIQSGNDASVALAEFIAGSEEAFASLMNQYALKIGLSGTNYVNATGLPHEQHYTTARDLALLSRVIIREYPESYKLYSQKEYTYNNIKQYNRNKLLWQDKFVDGLKTGHTESAGYCLAASADRDGMRLISVVLGTSSENSRSAETQKLLTFGFRFFETHRLYEAGKSLTTARIWKGEQNSISLGLTNDLYVTIPRGQYDQLDASMSINSQIIAPAKKGQIFGRVNIGLNEDVLVQRDLVNLISVESAGFVGRLVDEVKMFFE